MGINSCQSNNESSEPNGKPHNDIDGDSNPPMLRQVRQSDGDLSALSWGYPIPPRDWKWRKLLARK